MKKKVSMRRGRKDVEKGNEEKEGSKAVAERRKNLLSKYVNQLLYVAVQIVHQSDSRDYSNEIN